MIENEFTWEAYYIDGSKCLEKDGDIITSFRELKKDNIKVFKFVHTENPTQFFGFNALTGEFYLFGNKYTFSLNNKPITGIKDETYNDIIQYKHFMTDYNLTTNTQSDPYTDAYYIGWKKYIEQLDKPTYVKLITCFDTGLKIDVKLVSKEPYKGTFTCFRNNNLYYNDSSIEVTPSGKSFTIDLVKVIK